MLCNHHVQLILKHFNHFQREFCSHSAVAYHSLLLIALGNHHSAVSMDIPILNFSYK